MARPRRTFKSERTGQATLAMRSSPATTSLTQGQQDAPFNSGDTILVDDGSDATTIDGLVDDGYHKSHENKKGGKSLFPFRILW